MRPRHALTGVVAVVGGIALLWCAWLVLRANLTTGTTVAVDGGLALHSWITPPAG